MALLGGLGGGLRRRADQDYRPPAAAATVGSRNVFRGRLVVIFGTASDGSVGLFVYSGPPAPGNLIASITAVAGTDNKGNPYQAGFTSYSSLGFTQLLAGVLNFFETGGAQAGTIEQDGLTNLLLIAPVQHNADKAAVIELFSEPPATPQVVITGQVPPVHVTPATTAMLEIQGGGEAITAGGLLVNATAFGSNADLELHSLLGLAARTAPGTPPAGFGYLYVNSSDGSLHYKGHSGTDTMIAPG